jgi:hypothetical protein
MKGTQIRLANLCEQEELDVKNGSNLGCLDLFWDEWEFII